MTLKGIVYFIKMYPVYEIKLSEILQHFMKWIFVYEVNTIILYQTITIWPSTCEARHNIRTIYIPH